METDSSDAESITSELSEFNDEPQLIEDSKVTNISMPDTSTTSFNKSLVDLEDNEEEFSKINHIDVNLSLIHI